MDVLNGSQMNREDKQNKGQNAAAYIIDDDMKIIYVNRTMKEQFPSAVVGKHCYKSLFEEDTPCDSCPLKHRHETQLLYNARIGKWMDIKAAKIDWEGQGERDCVMVSVINDIEHRAKAQKLVLEDALRMEHSDFTFGCLDEENFYKAARAYLETETGISSRFSMYALEIENIRIFNLWHGREAGQRYVEGYANELKRFAALHGGVVGYFGGARFAYLVPEQGDRVNVLQRELTKVQGETEDGSGFHCAIGIYRIEDPDIAVETMYDRAAIALDTIRDNYSLRYIHYDPAMDRKLDEEIAMLSDIRRGLKEKEFTFFVQPKCDMRTGKVLGGEALVRWIHKDQGLVPPGRFIPILEKSGFTVIVDKVVWEAVVRWQRALLDEGHKPLPISVNISKTDLFAIDVPEFIIGICKKYNVPHELIELEITESAYAEHFDDIKATIARLKEAGFPMLMDDFGSGYSSLNMLKNISFDILKFDMKFLRGDEIDKRRGLDILESVVNMARLLTVPVIIEGVETQDQVEDLMSMGCRYAQGYFYHKPMPKEDYGKLIENPDNISYDGYVSKRVEQIHMREFMDEMPETESVINNMLGPIGFGDYDDEKIEVVRVNEPFYELFSAEAGSTGAAIREHTTPEDYAQVKKLLDTAFQNIDKSAEAIVRIRLNNGRCVDCLLYAFFVKETVGHKRFCITCRDLTHLIQDSKLVASE